MAEILGSAVANESISKLFSILSGSPGEHESAEEKAERLEMAVLKIHSVIALSDDWKIVHQPLLNWKAKLKRVAKEGDQILHAHGRRATERKRDEETARQASVRKRITRAAKRFMPFGRREDDNPNYAAVRKFERLAVSSDEFFRYVQFGGPPKSLISLRVPTGPLLAGKTLEHSIRKGSQDALLFLHPSDGDRACSRKEIVLYLSYDDTLSWEKNVKLCVVFHLLEHIDIMGIVMSSLELLPPQFSAACATIREFLREMIMQETSFSSPSVISMWCGAKAWKFYHYSTDKGCTDGKLQLPLPIIRVDAICFKLPSNISSSIPADNSSLPLELICRIGPQLVPKKYSEDYEQIEPQALQELWPKVTNEGRLACNGNWWCPRSSTYLSTAPVLSVPPPTLQQQYMMEHTERLV